MNKEITNHLPGMGQVLLCQFWVYLKQTSIRGEKGVRLEPILALSDDIALSSTRHADPAGRRGFLRKKYGGTFRGYYNKLPGITT
jgi:hypothetical protein